MQEQVTEYEKDKERNDVVPVYKKESSFFDQLSSKDEKPPPSNDRMTFGDSVCHTSHLDGLILTAHTHTHTHTHTHAQARQGGRGGGGRGRGRGY